MRVTSATDETSSPLVRPLPAAGVVVAAMVVKSMKEKLNFQQHSTRLSFTHRNEFLLKLKPSPGTPMNK